MKLKIRNDEEKIKINLYLVALIFVCLIILSSPLIIASLIKHSYNLETNDGSLMCKKIDYKPQNQCYKYEADYISSFGGDYGNYV